MSPHPRYRLYLRSRDLLGVLADTFRYRSADPAGHELEAELAARFGAGEAVCVPRARTGLCRAVRALVPAGRAVILSPLTIADAVSAVLLAGAVPRFADVRPGTGMLDPEAVAAAMDDRVGGVIVTHLLGGLAETAALAALCRPRGIALIEDAAQSLGALAARRCPPTAADAIVLSFGLFKQVTALGGGAVIARDPAVARHIRSGASEPAVSRPRLLARLLLAGILQTATWPPFFQVLPHPAFRLAFRLRIHSVTRLLNPDANPVRRSTMPAGWSRQMNPPQARLARAGLDRLDEDICARATLARRYMAGLHGIAGLALPEFAGPIPAFTHFPIRCADRDGLLRFLTRRGRDAGAMTLPDCAGLPAFAAFNAECPAARCWARDALLLPCYARYPLTEADANVRAVREFFGTGGTGAHPGAA